MKAKTARNKTVLARALGISRQWLNEWFKEPNAPPARSDGSHDIAAWKKFLAKQAGKSKAPTEKERLQIRKLQLQCEREEFSLGQERKETHEKILAQLMSEFLGILQLVKTEVYKMRVELSPKFTGLANAREVYRTWEAREKEMFRTIASKRGFDPVSIKRASALCSAPNSDRFKTPLMRSAKMSSAWCWI